MKIAYFDCFSGISGDMVLGALLDSGLSLTSLNAEIAKLGLKDVTIASEATSRHAIAATHAQVRVSGVQVTATEEHHLQLPSEATAGDKHEHEHAHAHEHHRLNDILERIASSDLDSRVKEQSIRIFERLGAAESEVHGAEPEEVHLHEVGALEVSSFWALMKSIPLLCASAPVLRVAPTAATPCPYLVFWPFAATCRASKPISAPSWSPRPGRRLSRRSPGHSDRHRLSDNKPSATGRAVATSKPYPICYDCGSERAIRQAKK